MHVIWRVITRLVHGINALLGMACKNIGMLLMCGTVLLSLNNNGEPLISVHSTHKKFVVNYSMLACTVRIYHNR